MKALRGMWERNKTDYCIFLSQVFASSVALYTTWPYFGLLKEMVIIKKNKKNSMFFLFVCLNCGNTFIRRENYVAQIVPQCFFPSPLIICYAAFIFSALLYIRGCQRYSWQKRSHLAPWTRSVKTAKKGSQIWRLFTAYLFILVEKHCVLQG